MIYEIAFLISGSFFKKYITGLQHPPLINKKGHFPIIKWKN